MQKGSEAGKRAFYAGYFVLRRPPQAPGSPAPPAPPHPCWPPRPCHRPAPSRYLRARRARPATRGRPALPRRGTGARGGPAGAIPHGAPCTPPRAHDPRPQGHPCVPHGGRRISRGYQSCGDVTGIDVTPITSDASAPAAAAPVKAPAQRRRRRRRRRCPPLLASSRRPRARLARNAHRAGRPHLSCPRPDLDQLARACA